MSEIVPRWEWRSFGRSFPRAEAELRKLSRGGAQESDEVYLLSAGGDNVKIRDGLMDIKVLREVNPDGLEQWMPVMKAGFPLSASDVTKICEALRVGVPRSLRASYAAEELLTELPRAGSEVRVVNVHKRRVRYTVCGCMAELSDITGNGKPVRTIAVESEDAAAVMRGIRELGLGDYVNTSYPRGLTALLDGAPSRYAVIDCGTNSIKFNISEKDSGGRWHAVVDRAEVTRLGEDLEKSGVIDDAALERTIVAISAMVAEAKQREVCAIAAVGTAGLRIARNGREVLDAIRERTGVRVDVISGEEESRLAYLAAKAGLGTAAGSLVVFDTGGGSTQFTFGHDSQVDERFSVQVGAVRYTESFGLAGPVSREVLDKAVAAIADDLSRIDRRPVPDALIGMGGAITNITAVKHGLATYDPDVVQGTVLDREEIDRQIELYRSRDVAGRRAVVGLQPKRADVILAGACIVRTIMEKLSKHTLTVSDRGLRHGVLAERFEG